MAAANVPMFSVVNEPVALVLLVAVRPDRVASVDCVCCACARVTVTV